MESYIKAFPYSQSEANAELPKIGGDENRFLKYSAIRICHPRLFTILHTYEPEFEEYPLKWLPLGISRNRHAYEEFKQGNLPEEIITNEVDTDGYLEEVVDIAEQIPSYRSRMKIITEITENYTDRRYASVICALLPQIEYLMWRYAAYLDARHDEEILIDANYSNFWNFSPRGNDNLKLKGKNGSIMEKAQIGELVKHTVLSEYLTPEIVEYFGEEIFSDRNPILHGNSDDYNTKLEAAKKIVFFKHVCEQLVDTISEQFADELDDSGILEDIDVPVDLMASEESV